MDHASMQEMQEDYLSEIVASLRVASLEVQ